MNWYKKAININNEPDFDSFDNEWSDVEVPDDPIIRAKINELSKEEKDLTTKQKNLIDEVFERDTDKQVVIMGITKPAEGFQKATKEEYEELSKINIRLRKIREELNKLHAKLWEQAKEYIRKTKRENK